MAITANRVIIAAVVTTGEKNDGKQLDADRKSRAVSMDVETLIVNIAYLEKNNLVYTNGNTLDFIAKLNPLIT